LLTARKDALPGTPHRLQNPKWPTGSGKRSNPNGKKIKQQKVTDKVATSIISRPPEWQTSVW